MQQGVSIVLRNVKRAPPIFFAQVSYITRLTLSSNYIALTYNMHFTICQLVQFINTTMTSKRRGCIENCETLVYERLYLLYRYTNVPNKVDLSFINYITLSTAQVLTRPTGKKHTNVVWDDGGKIGKVKKNNSN